MEVTGPPATVKVYEICPLLSLSEIKHLPIVILIISFHLNPTSFHLIIEEFTYLHNKFPRWFYAVLWSSKLTWWYMVQEFVVTNTRTQCAENWSYFKLKLLELDVYSGVVIQCNVIVLCRYPKYLYQKLIWF